MNSVGIQSPVPTSRVSFSTESDLLARAGGAAFDQRTAEAPRTHRRLLSMGANSLVIALLSPFALLTAGWVQRLLLAAVVLDIPFQFGTHFFYREDDAVRGALGGLSISVSTIALAGLYAAWFLTTLVKRNPGARPSLHCSLPLLFYLAVSTFSVLVAEDSRLALFQVVLLLETCLLYFYVANNVRTRRDVLFVVSMLLIGCLLESAVIIVMKLTVTSSTSWNLPIHLHGAVGKGGLTRAGGTVGAPNTAAAYLSLLLAPAASLLFADLGRSYRLLATAVLALGGIALIFTFSRGGWVAFALSITGLYLFVWRRRGLSLRAPIAVVVVVVLLFLPFQNLISERLLGDDKGSAESRIPLIRLALRIFEDHPFLGVGSNNFTVVMDRYLTSEFRSSFLYAVHNTYLLILAETGVVGFLAYLAFLFGTLRTGWRCWKFKDHLWSTLALGFTLALAGHMVQMGVDIFNDSPIAHLVLLIAGLLAAIESMRVVAPCSDPLSSIT